MFPTYFPEIKKLEKQEEILRMMQLFLGFLMRDEDFELLDEFTEEQYKNELNKIKPLDDFLAAEQPNMNLKMRIL